MKALDPLGIDSWHAHVYFDASSREAARALRETIDTELAGRIELRDHRDCALWLGKSYVRNLAALAD